MDDIKKPKIPLPYNGPKPQLAIADIFIQDSFSKDDERLWSHCLQVDGLDLYALI